MSTGNEWSGKDIVDQTGKTAIVTGANSGIGLIAARELAGHGAKVIVACRDVGKGEAAVEKIRVALAPRGNEAQLEVRRLDLADLASVREFAAGIGSDLERMSFRRRGTSRVPGI